MARFIAASSGASTRALTLAVSSFDTRDQEERNEAGLLDFGWRQQQQTKDTCDPRLKLRLCRHNIGIAGKTVLRCFDNPLVEESHVSASINKKLVSCKVHSYKTKHDNHAAGIHLLPMAFLISAMIAFCTAGSNSFSSYWIKEEGLQPKQWKYSKKSTASNRLRQTCGGGDVAIAFIAISAASRAALSRSRCSCWNTKHKYEETKYCMCVCMFVRGRRKE